MRIGILDANREKNYGCQRTRESLEALGADVIIFHPDDVVLRFSDTESSACVAGVRLEESLDACLVRRTRSAVHQAVELVQFLTFHKIPCVDPLEALVSPLSKTGTMMNSVGLTQIPETAIVSTLKALADVSWDTFPCIAKPLEGRKGIDVRLVNTSDDLRSHVEHMLQSGWRAMIQEYLNIQEEYRIMVVGEECIGAFRKLSSPGSVARNASQGAVFEKVHRPDLTAPALAAAQRNHCEICGIDLVETDQGIYLIEANRCPAFEAAEACGVDVAGPIASHLCSVAEKHAGGRDLGDC